MADSSNQNVEVKMEKEARDLIQSMRMSHRQPFWIILIILLGGVILPAGGLIDSFINPYPLNDFWSHIAVVALLIFLSASLFILPLCFQHVSFDGKGVKIKPLFKNALNLDWQELTHCQSRWYGATLQSTNQQTLRLLSGDKFYYAIISAYKIWENRLVDDSEGS